jgi:hypothetical protein
MKTRFFLLLVCALLAPRAVIAQGTAFTYQGRLIHGDGAANGQYEISFSLHDALTVGAPVGTPVTIAPVAVSNGLFTVTLDFGASVFTGASRWLEIAVTVFGSDQPVVTLVPRQPITPTPYALHAATALGLVNPANGPIEFKVNGQRALRLESTAFGLPNIIGGDDNHIRLGGAGSVISGGDDNVIESSGSVIGGGDGNSIRLGAIYAVIGGGDDNDILDNSIGASISGGRGNLVEENSALSFIGGGLGNQIQGSSSVIGGGHLNRIQYGAQGSVIAGGDNNTIGTNSHFSTIGGGLYNRILDESFHSTISGGASNFMENKVERSTIGGGANNTIGYFANATTIAGGMNNVIDGTTGGSTIGGGWFNHINEEASLVTIAGGGNNLVGDNAGSTVISGGEHNEVHASLGTVGGGQGNVILFPGHYATIAGGLSNLVGNYYGTVAGGVNNEVRAQYAAIGGGQENTIEAEADGSVIAGGSNNHIGANAVSNFIGGGGGNRIDAASSSAIVTGFDNHLGSYASVISGGRENGILENAEFSAIAGGENNHIAAGSPNSAIGGGGNNQILVNSSHAMIPGGLENVATNLAFAAGKSAYAVHRGAFVWADASDARFYSVSANEFAVRATGGARFATAVDGTGTPTAGAELAPGSGTWSSLSDRNAKENFAAANAREILEKVVALPMASWNYKAQGKDIRHLGPMAQDFHAAFGLGESDRTITTVDADGVALAAIQGLHAKLEEELKAKNARISELERRLEGIEKLLATASAR